MAADSRSSTPVVEHRFACARCTEPAGHIQLFGPESDAQLVRTSFTSQLTLAVAPAKFEHVRRAILNGDVRTLHAIDLELTPFFCPRCGDCYCGAHWQRRDVFDDDGWHDSIRGVCPEGHERMLED